MRKWNYIVPRDDTIASCSRSHRPTCSTRCVEVPIFLDQFFQQSQNLQSKPGKTLTWSLCGEKVE